MFLDRDCILLTSQVFGNIDPYYRIKQVRELRLVSFFPDQQRQELRVLSVIE
jgi:hypothetical protein